MGWLWSSWVSLRLPSNWSLTHESDLMPWCSEVRGNCRREAGSPLPVNTNGAIQTPMPYIRANYHDQGGHFSIFNNMVELEAHLFTDSASNEWVTGTIPTLYNLPWWHICVRQSSYHMEPADLGENLTLIPTRGLLCLSWKTFCP